MKPFRLAWIHGLHVFVAQTQAIHRAGSEVLNDHIRRLNQLANHLESFCALQIHRDASLIAIEVAEIAGTKPFQTARPVTLQRLDLDDVSTQVSQDHAAGRTHDRMTKVQYPNAFQRQFLYITHASLSEKARGASPA
jgi:hypothetical protein